LLTDIPQEIVEIILPRGQVVPFRLEYCRRQHPQAEAATIKDAGDDPDVTHQALIFAQVALTAKPDIHFYAGEGVGTATQPGLPVAVGEPAINPVPRQMITEHLQTLAAEQRYRGGFAVTVGIKNGVELAKHTMNERLGIIGGLSVLGTTGIVRPFSCSAYIASIHQAIDVARTNGFRHIAACTGATSEKTMRQQYGLPAMALVEMGDCVGAVLKYMRKAPVEQLSLAGGFGKFCKLAAGHLDLHSRKSTIDFSWLAEQAKVLGAREPLLSHIQTANTSQRALMLARTEGLALGDRISWLALQKAIATMARNDVALEVWTLDRQGNPVGYASSL
jgi:cobalt-precorrin-5B (C1)-methyltransferase